MEKWIILSMVFFALKALSQDPSEWVRIDCGSETSYRDTSDSLWQTDEDFIKTGKNKQVSRNSNTQLEQLNTLRVFTEQNKNCFTLPTPILARYFIRAVFYYGNYDGLSKPPTFNLEFDGNRWTTVVTSVTDPVYYEVIYASKGDNTSVCLARTQDKQFPFISMLEAWPLPDNMYAGMSRDLAWLSSYRYDYGGTDWTLGYPVDNYNRIWEPMIPSGLDVATANFTSTSSTIVDFPPDSVIINAVEAQSPADTISLPFKISKADGLNHVVVYYTEVALNYNETRSFDFYVNDKFMLTSTPKYRICSGEWANTQSVSALNVELRPTSDTTLPPIISAIEIYSASDPLVTVETSQDDLDGLAVFISTFEQLGGWSGDPCLPSDTVWQWLGCTGDDPPRVTSLNLSSYGLDGPLPDFSKMQDLETIDLRNNSFDGPIPDFLGNLPNLKLLNLRDNNFSGDIPHSITSNKKLKYDIKGNPLLPHHKGKRKALIIGLAVGLPLGLLLVIALAYFLTRKQPPPSQGQITIMQLGRPQGDKTAQGRPQEESGSVSASMETLIKPSQANGQNMPPHATGQNVSTPAGENIPVAANGRHTNQNAGNTNPRYQATEHTEPMAAGQNIPASINAGTTNQPSGVVSHIDMEEFDTLYNQ